MTDHTIPPQPTENAISRDLLSELIRGGVAKFDYEALLERHYRRWVRLADTVVDVGAHAGRHLVQLLSCVGNSGKVVAFEPLPDKFESLKSNYVSSNVILVNSALSKQNGVADFIFAEGSPEESGLKQRIFNSPAITHPKVIQVNVQILDNFIAELNSLSFIKIDAEGGEIDCLLGSENVLTQFRPVVSVEYGSPSYSAYGLTGDALFEFCEKRGYIIYDIFLRRLKELSQWRKAVDSIYWDFLCVPAEREPEFLDRVGP